MDLRQVNGHYRIDEVLKNYDLVLVDSCFFSYKTMTHPEGRRVSFDDIDINGTIDSWENLLGLIRERNHPNPYIYSTAGVKKELYNFLKALGNYTRFYNRINSNGKFNSLIKLQSDLSSLIGLLPICTWPRGIKTSLENSGSQTDRSLVEALLNNSIGYENGEQGTIITRDSDILFLYRGAILNSDENIRKRLLEKSSIHWYYPDRELALEKRTLDPVTHRLLGLR